MGFELWHSKNTGITRKGTTFSELQDVFIENITTKFICEPLACCKLEDNPFEVKGTLERLDFDILGVIDQNQSKLGFILKNELQENIQNVLKPFSLENIISESTPLAELIEILKENDYAFVLKRNKIESIVTRADINKPIVRIYIFGIISLFELHLNYWINKNSDGENWKEKINIERVEIAKTIYDKRKGNNMQLTLLECIQICDKRDILKNTTVFLEIFHFSKARFQRILKDVEKIRNELAHSQVSIIDNLKWETFVDTIQEVKSFLELSETKVTE